MPDQVNLYAPPKAQVEDVVPFASEAHEIRREHIKTEAAVRSIGTLYYIGAAGVCLGALALLGGRLANLAVMPGPYKEGMVFGLLVVGVFSFFVARDIRRFRPWARIASVILAALGLISAVVSMNKAPIGAVIQIYILYLLFSKKGRRLFESDYPAIIAATPDVKRKTSVVVWIALGLLVLVFLILLAVGAASGLRHK